MGSKGCVARMILIRELVKRKCIITFITIVITFITIIYNHHHLS